MFKCQRCGKKFLVDWRKYKGRRNHNPIPPFCSITCSNSKIHTDQTKNKISNTLKQKHPEHTSSIITCKCCGVKKEFPYKLRKRQFCSNSCTIKYNWTIPKYRKARVAFINKRIKDGLHKGWPHRNKFYKSYAEEFFSNVLDGRKIKYIFNKKEGMYFIDFAIDNKKIALEIDGSQHRYRVGSDKKKDKFLKSRGWKVYRIKWTQPQKIYGEIEKFLEFYHGV